MNKHLQYHLVLLIALTWSNVCTSTEKDTVDHEVIHFVNDAKIATLRTMGEWAF